MNRDRESRRPGDMLADGVGAAKRALYRDGRPGRLMRLWNRLDAMLYATGLLYGSRTAVLCVPGRSTGRVTGVPVAVADVDGADYLVSMLGPDANWVRNVDAASGSAVLRRRGRDIPVRLEPVPVGERPPILRRYAAIAPGARPHLGLKSTSPLADFGRIAARHPVYLIREGR